MRQFVDKALKKVDKIDKKQLVQILRRISDEYQLLGDVYDSMTDGVIVLNHEHSVDFLNKAAERYLPLDSRRMAKHPIWDVIGDLNISSFLKDNLLKQENAKDFEFSLPSGNRRRLLSITLFPLVKRGKIRGSIIHIEDITEKKEQEARLNQIEKLASLTTVTASIAHEIKNPLAAISIHVQLLEKAVKAQKTDTAFFKKHFSIVKEEIERLSDKIGDFLFTVRPMTLVFMKQNINDLLSNLVSLIEVELLEKKVQLKFSLEKDLPLIFCDERSLKQAFLNIIKNAMAAMEGMPGGLLKIKSSLEKKSQKVVVKISDNGCGVSEELQQKIFEPYFTTKATGSGLGLTIVYKIIQEHQGEILFDSQEGFGSSFIIKFPLFKTEKPLLFYEGSGEI